MSERDGYQPGVPCWVETRQPDPKAAVVFYTELFGWEVEETTQADEPGNYFVCRLRGREVAAIGSQPAESAPSAPVWTTYIWVESALDTATRVTGAGGSLVMEPFDSPDAGRMAVVADPAGAAFGVWQPGARKGAQLVNEPGAWSWSQLNTRETEGSKAFYRAVFGWETDSFGSGEGEITMWRVPGYLGGEPGQPVSRDVVAGMAPMRSEQFPDDVPPHWSIDFWVDDSDAIARGAEALGGKVVAPPFDTPISRTAVLADPHGASFSVTKVPGT